jgi:predicted O-methyltransferase YrrM
MIVEIAQDGCHFVEVGSFLGQSTVIMAYLIGKYDKDIIFDCVDIFSLSEYSDGEHERYINALNGEFFETFLNNLIETNSTDKINNIHKMTSLEAAKLYSDQSLDFIYLDASHETEDLHEDIKAWWPKLKMGGLLAGDDLDHIGVPKALEMFFKTDKDGKIPNSRSFRYGTWLVQKL